MSHQAQQFENKTDLELLRKQPELLKEIQKLETIAPGAGLALQFTSYDGQVFLLANREMPIPARKSDGFQGGETIATFENGDCYQTIRLIAFGLQHDATSLMRIELGAAAMDAIACLDRTSGAEIAA